MVTLHIDVVCGRFRTPPEAGPLPGDPVTPMDAVPTRLLEPPLPLFPASSPPPVVDGTVPSPDSPPFHSSCVSRVFVSSSEPREEASEEAATEADRDTFEAKREATDAERLDCCTLPPTPPILPIPLMLSPPLPMNVSLPPAEANAADAVGLSAST